jgi:hypothetical protein
MKTSNALILLFSLFFSSTLLAQELGFGAKGGLLVGTQANKRPLISYHADAFFEAMGAWQGDGTPRRLGFVGSLGYHRRGASYNALLIGNPNQTVISDIYHNLSLAALIKGGYQFNNLSPYYAGGLRLDYTMASEVVNPFDAQGVRPVNVGLWLGGGLEWAPAESPFGIFVEISVQPDITPQVFFARGTLIQYTDPFSGQTTTRTVAEDQRITNLCLEATVGIKFIKRKDAPSQSIN